MSFASLPRLSPPTAVELATFLERESRAELTYREVGATRGELPPGYDHDHNRIRLGTGAAAYGAACEALRTWRPFPAWARVGFGNSGNIGNSGETGHTSLEVDRVVVLVIHAFGLYWLSSSRIVYLVDEATPVRRFGFAYGTLPGHVECGEERFTVEWLADDTVWYDLRSFSRPRHPLVRVTRPLARRLQLRFIVDSLAGMQGAVMAAVQEK